MTDNNFEEYLRNNPMPTKRIDKRGYWTIEKEYIRIDEEVDEND